MIESLQRKNNQVIQSCQDKTNSLNNTVELIKKDYNTLEQQFHSLDHNISVQLATCKQQIQATNLSINSKISSINTTHSLELEKMKMEYTHIEKGTISCGGTTGWSDGVWGQKFVTSMFSRPYTSIPVGFTSVSDWKSYTNKMFVRMDAYVASINTTHIKVACVKDGPQSDIIAMYVNWITFPS